MPHSTVTDKGQTTIPGKIRDALKIRPGDRLEYAVEGDHATIRVHPGTRSLKGALASGKGRDMSFAQIRAAAAKAAQTRGWGMTRRRLLDTNLVVRHLIQDHPKQSKAASKLFEACDRGEVTLVLLPVVLAECLFVVESFYEHPRREIAKVLRDLISCPGVELNDLPIHVDALKRYQDSNVHFVDCLIAAHAAADDVPVATFDSDFRKFPDVRVDIDVKS